MVSMSHALWLWMVKLMDERRILTYLLTPWSRVLLEKLTGIQLVNKFSAFYGTQRFITASTSARHLTLSWASSIQSTPTHPTSWRSIVSFHLRPGLPSGLFLQVSPPNPCIHLSPPPYVLHVPLISFFAIWSPEQYWVRSTEMNDVMEMICKQTSNGRTPTHQTARPLESARRI